jgi:predicted dehydrogenase/threonine dehydrogenase-like Zn-dependent dehydrogenase
MKQVLLRDGRAVVEEVPEPAAGAGRVLVRTAFSVLSAGTERAVLESTGAQGLLGQAADPRRVRRAFEILRDEGLSGIRDRIDARRAGPPEAVPGYAAAGMVVAVGRGVADLPPGTAVACAGAGHACHAEIIAVPRNLVTPVPPGVALDEAAFTTIGAIALQGVRRAGLQVGECAVVLGLGLVGTLAAQILGAAGAIVLGFDAERARAARCRDLGIEAYDLAARDPRDEVPRATGGLLADAVVVCAAARGSEVTNLALRLCRKKGRVVLVGDVGMEIDRALMYEKELDLLMSTSYGPGRYDPDYEEKGIDYPSAHVRWTENRNMGAFLRLCADGRVRVRPLIDHVLPIEEAPAAYDLISGGSAERPLGVVLRYPGAAVLPATGGAAGVLSVAVPRQGAMPAAPVPAAPVAPAAADAGSPDPVDTLPAGAATIGVALCGAGAFVKAAHLPALRRAGGFEVRAVVAGTPTSARDTARRHGIARAATTLGEIVRAQDIDLVLIGTRHHLHAAQAREALGAGRHVLVEKPLCLDETDIAPLVAEARRARRLLAVGFNRRYSPLAVRAREVLDRLRGPALVVYRVNAGALPSGHWAIDPEQGGGRILGECCHFVDLLLWLLRAPLAGIEARALPSDGSGVVLSDSFAATLSLADGSRAVLAYTGLGDAALAKERLEIFKGGAALVLDDFRALEVHGGPGGSLTLPQQDKGIAAQWEAIGRRLRGQPSTVITLGEVEAAMRATFLLDKAVRGERCAS